MPFGSYEASPEQAFASASRVLKETGAAAIKLEGGEAMAATVAFLSARGIPVMGHVGLTPQAVNILGGYGARGRGHAEQAKIAADAEAIAPPAPSRWLSRAWWNRWRHRSPPACPAP